MNTYELISLIINCFIALTGLSAVLLYLWQKHTAKRTAATLVLTQIDSIETTIKYLKGIDCTDGKGIYKSKRVLTQNYWEDNRHILSKCLGDINVKLIEDFYSCAEEIEKSREAICSEVTASWKNKDLVSQIKVLDEIYKNPNVNLPDSPIEWYFKSGYSFSARIPSDMMKQYLNQFEKLSGTCAYEKLLRLSYR